MTERGTLAYLYWPTCAAALITLSDAEHVVTTIARWFGLA